MGLFDRLKAALGGLFSSAEDPRQATASVYQRQVDLLRKLQEALGEVSASKRQLDLQTERLKSKLPELQDQAREALINGREDVARLTLQRRRAAAVELEHLEAQTSEVAQEEQRLALAEQRLAARIEEFRTRQDVISARYTAAEAQVRINEALAGVSEELTSLGLALEQAEAKAEHMQARASAIDELMGAGVLPGAGGSSRDLLDREIAGADEMYAVEGDLEALKRQIREGPS